MHCPEGLRHLKGFLLNVQSIKNDGRAQWGENPVGARLAREER
jgi:hypothetical protein